VDKLVGAAIQAASTRSMPRRDSILFDATSTARLSRITVT
jgi:hypothetical protein